MLLLFNSCKNAEPSAAEIRASANAPLEQAGITPPVLVGGLAALESQIVYPLAAKLAEVEGTVTVVFIVSKEGAVKRAQIDLNTRKGYGLDNEAVRVVKLAQFAPAKNGQGNPVEVEYALPITFRLK